MGPVTGRWVAYSGGNTTKGAQKNEGQNSTIKCREQHGQGDGNARPTQSEPKFSEATVAQLICGNAERVQDVVKASGDDHNDEVEADLGRSMKLPGKGGTTLVRSALRV